MLEAERDEYLGYQRYQLQKILTQEKAIHHNSNINDRILPFLNEWRSRLLKEIYAIFHIDGQRFKVRSEGTVKDKVVYTNNPIEGVHRKFRKVTKGKSHFPDDISLLKMLYL